MTTEELRGKIKHAIENHTDPFSDYDLGAAADLILQACKDTGMVMLSEDQTGLPTYLVDAPNIRRVEEINTRGLKEALDELET